MSLYQTLVELIDLRSFSNLWFWIALAVMWSSASHWVLGVPYDMVVRARRLGGQPMADLHDITRININRIMHIGRVSGLIIMTFGSFCLTVLCLLGFVYRIEFAQAIFLLALPMAVLGLLSFRTASRIEALDPQGEALCKRLQWHRFLTQLLGFVSIFITGLWGMYQNLSVSVLGG